MYEDDIDYARRRLNDTLVRLLDGTPFFVTSTTRGGHGKLLHCGTNMVTGGEMSVLHSELDLEPVSLGFINLSSGAVYTCRKPLRRDWRQGLSMTNVQIYGDLRRSNIQYKHFTQPILKQYPSYEQALSRVAKKNSVAFSREFSLLNRDDTTLVYYKQYEVGIVQDNIPVLHTNKFFLQEHLAESLG